MVDTLFDGSYQLYFFVFRLSTKRTRDLTGEKTGQLWCIRRHEANQDNRETGMKSIRPKTPKVGWKDEKMEQLKVGEGSLANGDQRRAKWPNVRAGTRQHSTERMPPKRGSEYRAKQRIKTGNTTYL
jgi:hypothetical protein